MNEDQWVHDDIMSKEVYMNEQNEDETIVNEKHVDCSDAFNISQVFIWWDFCKHLYLSYASKYIA